MVIFIARQHATHEEGDISFTNSVQLSLIKPKQQVSGIRKKRQDEMQEVLLLHRKR